MYFFLIFWRVQLNLIMFLILSEEKNPNSLFILKLLSAQLLSKLRSQMQMLRYLKKTICFKAMISRTQLFLTLRHPTIA